MFVNNMTIPTIHNLCMYSTVLAKPILVPVNGCGNTLDMVPLTTHPTALHHLLSIVCRAAVAIHLD